MLQKKIVTVKKDKLSKSMKVLFIESTNKNLIEILEKKWFSMQLSTKH